MFNNLIDYHIYKGDELPKLQSLAGYDYIVAGNGLFKRGSKRYFDAMIPIQSFSLPLLAPLKQSIHLKIPKIDSQYLSDILKLFQRCALISKNGCESISFLRWNQPADDDISEGRYELVLPDREKANSCSVEYVLENQDSILLEIHSHHRMSAFFSSVDDADEKGFRFYGVLGNIFTDPKCKIRLGLYGDFFSISLNELFDGDLSFLTGNFL